MEDVLGNVAVAACYEDEGGGCEGHCMWWFVVAVVKCWVLEWHLLSGPEMVDRGSGYYI